MNKFKQQNGKPATKHILKDSMEDVDSVTQRSILMDHTIDLLAEKAKSSELYPEFYNKGLLVLETLPLTTAEFGLATRRLQNALVYSNSAEFGAAAFELRLLKGQLSG